MYFVFFFNFFCWSLSKDALESAISDTYCTLILNFMTGRAGVYYLLFNFRIWCRMSRDGPLADLRLELKDSTKTPEQNQSMYYI